MSSSVPEGWSRIQIGDIGSFFGGLTGKTAKDFGDGHPFLTYMQVYSQQTSDMEAMNSVLINEGEKQNTVAYGDVLFTTSSETPDEIGMTDVFLEVNQTPYLNSFCFGLRPITPSSIDPTFGKYVFRGDNFREDMRPLAQGSTRFNLSKGNLAKLSLLIPPLPEQKKIASILTSVDEVIENTQKQIDKLQDLKKATMNKLLTKGIGHTEFKDSELGRIPKSWQLVPLSDHASRIRSKNGIGNTNVLTASAKDGLINQREYFNKSVASADISHYTLLRKGDFAYNKSYSHGYPVGVVRRLERYDYGVLSPLYICFSIESKECDETYLSYYFDSHRFERELNSVVQEGARAHGLLNIPVNDFFDRELLLPPLPEQKKIASILTYQDEVIENTQKQIDKLQDLKKSLMQDLLTGKVRVTVN